MVNPQQMTASLPHFLPLPTLALVAHPLDPTTPRIWAVVKHTRRGRWGRAGAPGADLLWRNCSGRADVAVPWATTAVAYGLVSVHKHRQGQRRRGFRRAGTGQSSRTAQRWVGNLLRLHQTETTAHRVGVCSGRLPCPAIGAWDATFCQARQGYQSPHWHRRMGTYAENPCSRGPITNNCPDQFRPHLFL